MDDKKVEKANLNTANLNTAELAMLDALITIAQQQGHGFDQVFDEDDLAEAQQANVEGRMEDRNGGISRLLEEQNQRVVERIQEFSRELGAAPTLGQLIELRARAIKGR